MEEREQARQRAWRFSLSARRRSGERAGRGRAQRGLPARGLHVFTYRGLNSDPSTGKSSARRETKPVVFVVDDEPLLLELASALLSELNCRIETFRDGESALKAFVAASPRPALIITDYAMHRMDGMKLIQECRRLQPTQRIILTSGTVDEVIYRNSTVKPDTFLAKPYQIKEFMDAVQPLLAG
jgi:CheY-like chemotaxis protein